MWWSWGAPFQAVCQTLLDHIRIFRRNLAKAQEERKLEILLASVFATKHQAKTKKKKKKRREVNLLVKCPFKCHLFKAAIFTIYSVVPPPITRYSTTLFDFHHYMIYSYLFAYWLFFFQLKHWMKLLIYFGFMLIENYNLWLRYLNNAQYKDFFFSLKGLSWIEVSYVKKSSLFLILCLF